MCEATFGSSSTSSTFIITLLLFIYIHTLIWRCCHQGVAIDYQQAKTSKRKAKSLSDTFTSVK
jgi:hypothetical protein